VALSCPFRLDICQGNRGKLSLVMAPGEWVDVDEGRYLAISVVKQ